MSEEEKKLHAGQHHVNHHDGRGDVADERSITRREFLKTAATASVAAGATLAGASFFVERNAVPVATTMAVNPSYRVAGTEELFAVAKGDDAKKLVDASLDAIGGMERFVAKGDRVLIKVNCAFARPAWVGATTSPEVLSRVIQRCYAAGASLVVVTDNPISDAKRCFEVSGLGQATVENGGKIFWPSAGAFRRVRVNEGVIGVWEVLAEPLRWCNKLIGVPTVKSHNLSGASLAMKNWYGFFGGSRSRFHQNIHEVIAELGAFVTPTLVMMDGMRVLMRNGPTGGSADDVVAGHTVAAAVDQVAADALGVEMLGLKPSDVAYVPMAAQRGLGRIDRRTLSGYKEVSA